MKNQVAVEFDTNVTTNLAQFLTLLKNSLSLDLDDKFRVIAQLSDLSQTQVNQLIAVFNEETIKFETLAKQHPRDIEILRARAEKNWTKLCFDLVIPVQPYVH